MDDEPTTPDSDRVSFDKSAAPAAGAPVRPGLVGRLTKPSLTVDGSPMPAPPKSVRNAALALCVSALGALIASLVLFGEKDWLRRTYTDGNPDKGKKGYRTAAQIADAADKAPSTSLLVTIVLAAALCFAAYGVWRGRYWARWSAVVLWVLATLTGTFASFIYLLGIGSNEPLPFKIPTFVSAAGLIAAVVLVSIRPSVAYFALTRAPRPNAAAGAPRRGGLFGPRPARPGFSAPGSAATRGARGAATAAKTGRDAATARDGAERSRAKQRASTESVAKGAELARAKAKASKSRRSGV